MITQDASSKIIGFLYQFERALYRIFSSEHNSVVFGIETVDDVVEEAILANGLPSITFEQDKHSLDTRAQPYQDSSKNLWHTLHIWLDAMKVTREKYDEVTYCLVTNRIIDKRNLVVFLSEAKSEEQINTALAMLKEQAKKITGKVKSIAEEVLTYSDEELIFLIKNIELLDSHGTTSGISPKEATIQLLHLPSEVKEHGDNIYQTLLGFMIDKCNTAWKAKQPVELTKEPFANLLNSEISLIKRKNFTEQPFFQTAFKNYLKQDNAEHLFIKQLQSIDISTTMCNRALEHYWAFYAERVRLQQAGEIPLSAWRARDDVLYNRWLQIKDCIELGLESEGNSQKLNMLKKIYTDTTDPNYTASLAGQRTENLYFTTGNYHDLANSPSKETFIHWHNDFLKIKEK
ncbi:ABC-three component system protein [Photorhabdus africana]|uniref:ABC-three component system protein n=1 Tax=Photorhabdus africana TaxID=3097554 RepID=UPI002B40067F|nr:ABC-three component system protein [Photorhabdus sp. CRI-LC]